MLGNVLGLQERLAMLTSNIREKGASKEDEKLEYLRPQEQIVNTISKPLRCHLSRIVRLLEFSRMSMVAWTEPARSLE